VAGTLLSAVFKDQLGNIVLQAQADTAGMSSSPEFQTILFEDATTGNWIKLVVDVPLLLAWMAGVPGTDIYGARLPVEGAAVENAERRVLSLRLYDDGITQPPTSPLIIDRVLIVPGYNVELAQDITNDSLVDTKVIDLDVQAGAGAGLAPCDSTPPTPQPSKMGVQADSAGNVNIEAGDDCYNITPVPELSSFMIEGVCAACCTCADYENVLIALDKLFHKTKCAHCLLRDAHDGPNILAADHCTGSTLTVCGLPAPASPLDPFYPATPGQEASYTNGVTLFNQYIAAVHNVPVLTVNGMRGAAYKGASKRRTGAPNFVTFVCSIKNNYREDIRVKANSFAYTPTFTPGVGHAVVQEAWEYNRECAVGHAGEQEVPDTASPTPIAKGHTAQVYIYLKTANDQPLTGARLHVTVDVETLDAAHSWALSAETCV
jgi:hypothetical protein